MLVARGLSPYKIGAKVLFDLDSDYAETPTNGAEISSWLEKVSAAAMTKETSTWPTAAIMSSIAKLNGHKVLQFFSDRVTRASFVLPSKWTFVCVVYRTSASSNYWLCEQGTDAGSVNGMYFFDGGNGMFASRQTNSTRYITASASWVGSAATWYTRVCVNDQGTTQTARRNGTGVTPATTVGTFGTAQAVTDTLYVGGRSGGAINTDGRFARILIFDGALTTDQCQQVERYLQRIYRHY